jgi:BNR/Asp-box repeat.
MKKTLLLTLLALTTATLNVAADDAEQYVPSNWGGWQNLSLGTTDITYYTKDQLPMDVQVSGQTIHVAWTDWKPNAAGEFCLWYRRSTDAGKTWEEPRAVVKSTTMNMTDINYVGGSFGSNTKWMEVEGQDVHFVTIIKSVTSDDVEQSQVLYTYSHDGGATFQQRVLAESSQEEGYYKYRTFPYGRPHVEADGQTVVIAFQYSNDGYNTRVDLLRWRTDL